MKSLQLVAGVDVSKDALDVFYNDQAGKEHYLKVSNDMPGFLLLLQKAGHQRTFVMEMSGPYYLKFAFFLSKAGSDVRVENPLVIKRFIQMQLERNKNDRKDARWLYRYATQREAPVWSVPDDKQLQCTQIISSSDLLTRQLTQLHNQLHAINQSPIVCKQAVKAINQTIIALTKQLSLLEIKLTQLLAEWQGEQLKNISSIPGLGKKAVALLIVYTNGFKKIANYKQLIALAGLAPKEYSSGTSIRGKTSICKMGNGRLRNVLYMCAMSAIKHNTSCKDLFNRLKAKGKNGKLALIAVCNKLLKQAFAIATKGQMYQDGYSSCIH